MTYFYTRVWIVLFKDFVTTALVLKDSLLYLVILTIKDL